MSYGHDGEAGDKGNVGANAEDKVLALKADANPRDREVFQASLEDADPRVRHGRKPGASPEGDSGSA